MNKRANMFSMVVLSMLTALTVVLQLVSGMFSINGVGINFTLIPILVAGVLYGIKGGLITGIAAGSVILYNAVSGAEPFGNALFGISPVFGVFVTIVRCALTGVLGALIYRAVAGTGVERGRRIAGYYVSALSMPILNTGLFFLLYSLLFHQHMLASVAGSELGGIFQFLIFGVAGVNFLAELVTIIIIAPPLLIAVHTRIKSNRIA